MTFVNLLSIAAALVVLVRCVCIASHLSRKDFAHHQARFYVLAASYALSGSGAFATAFDWHLGPHMLLIGISGFFVAERRMASKPV